MKKTKESTLSDTLVCKQTITFHLKSGASFAVKSYGAPETQDLQRSFAKYIKGESSAPKSYSQIIISDGTGHGISQFVQLPFSEVAAITYVEDKA